MVLSKAVFQKRSNLNFDLRQKLAILKFEFFLSKTYSFMMT